MPCSTVPQKLEACGADRDSAIERFAEIRRESEALTANLTPEDQSIQSMPDVSPTKWHLAHTTWFFETFILTRLDPGYRVFDPAFAYLFNSYYEAVGPRHPRPERGLLSRPAADVVAAYRDHVSAAMTRFFEEAPAEAWRAGRTPCRTGGSARATASGADPDGHQACLLGEPTVAGLSGSAASNQRVGGTALVGRVCPAAW